MRKYFTVLSEQGPHSHVSLYYILGSWVDSLGNTYRITGDIATIV